MMDPYLGLLTFQDIPPEKQRELSRQLREQSVGGAALSVTDLPEVSAQGRLMQTGAQTAARDIGLQEARKARERNYREVGLAKASGRGGLPTSRVGKEFEDEGKKASKYMSIFNRWQPDYIAELPFGPAASVENWAARSMGVGNVAQGEWWSDYKSMYENVKRHGLFGAALTGTELAEWKKAEIQPTDTAEQVQSKLNTQKRVVQFEIAKSARTALHKWDPTYVYYALQYAMPEEAWGDLDSYIAGQHQGMQGSDIARKQNLEEMSEEEIRRRLQEYE
jgi:hypothetical protein